jgi:hypothetical protein
MEDIKSAEESQISPEMEEFYTNFPVSDIRITNNYTVDPVNTTDWVWQHKETNDRFIGNIDEFNEYLKNMLSNPK